MKLEVAEPDRDRRRTRPEVGGQPSWRHQELLLPVSKQLFGLFLGSAKHVYRDLDRAPIMWLGRFYVPRFLCWPITL